MSFLEITQQIIILCILENKLPPPPYPPPSPKAGSTTRGRVWEGLKNGISYTIKFNVRFVDNLSNKL
jgi:hypothetical protein